MKNKGKFIYVSGEKAKNLLLSKGYNLIHTDSKLDVYIFTNNNNYTFSNDENFKNIDMVFSDTMIF